MEIELCEILIFKNQGQPSTRVTILNELVQGEMRASILKLGVRGSHI